MISLSGFYYHIDGYLKCEHILKADVGVFEEFIVLYLHFSESTYIIISNKSTNTMYYVFTKYLKIKTFITCISLCLIILVIWSCKAKQASVKYEVDTRTSVEMVTDYDTIVLTLYNETPLHRDNFIKLVKERAYDGLLFHRVIEEFMIQGGDPDSRKAVAEETLGNGDVPYKIDAEFRSNLFHKRGALGAARDGNPERASSGIQFYIVQRGIQTDSMLDKAEIRINENLAKHYASKDLANKPIVDALQKAIEVQNMEQYRILNDSLDKIAKDFTNYEKYQIPEAHRAVYKSQGGTPHLDQNYTVFGEVIRGLDVVDLIAKVKTDTNNRPISDVRIRSVRILEQE